MKRIAIALALLAPVAFFASCKSSTCSTAAVVLCDDCGVEKGSGDCCDPDAEHCGDCGKIKGSPGCCE